MRIPRVVPAVFAAIAILTAGLAEAASAEFPGRNGLLAYTADDGIHTIRPDGTEDRLIIRAGAVRSVQWSPNGREVAFTDGDELRLARADGTRRRTVIRGARLDALSGFDIIDGAAWAPDGRRIVFAAGDGDDDDLVEGLFTVRRDGASLRELRDGGAHPQWTPDGRRIAFLTFSPYCEDIGVRNRLAFIAPRGGQARAVTRRSCWSDYDLSPDGRKAVVVEGAGIDGTIRVVDLRTRRMQTLSPPAGVSASGFHGLTWSPDGEWITFTHVERPQNPGGRYAFHVYAIRPDGQSARPLFTLQGGSFAGGQDMSWQPLP